jgi:hypothetical protein
MVFSNDPTRLAPLEGFAPYQEDIGLFWLVGREIPLTRVIRAVQNPASRLHGESDFI